MTIISAVFMFFVTSSMQGVTACGLRPHPLDAADVITSDSKKDEKFKGKNIKLTSSKTSGYRPKGFTTPNLAYLVKNTWKLI